MHLSLKRARRAAATAAAIAVAATGVLTAACTPESAGYKVVSGTIKGADGKYRRRTHGLRRARRRRKPDQPRIGQPCTAL